MDLQTQLKRIKRFLRDPDNKIWSDDFLIKLYNDVQEELNNVTHSLKEFTAIRIPPLYHFSYMHDWEWRYMPSDESVFYQCFRQHQQADHVHTHDWEVQQVWAVTPDVTDRGHHFTHPWESMFDTPGEEMKVRFPENLRSIRHISWDRQPLQHKEKSELMMLDPSYQSYTGDPIYYHRDELDNSFVLYPRTTQANWLDGTTQGIAMYTSDDTVDSETGVVMRKLDNTPSMDYGTTVDIIEPENNVILFYEKNTTDLSNTTDESDFPIYLRRYIEYGVISRAYGANTDGRIRSLADYWNIRYELGIQAIKRYNNIRYRDRSYKLRTKTAVPQIRRKHVRLPSTYPDAI